VKEYAKGFYKSAAWKRARQQVITRSNGLCERCKARGIYKPGYIVHHKEYITPDNISNPNITLNLDNLEYVCEDCHNKEHHRNDKKKRYAFDEAGNLISPPIRSKFREGSTPRAGD
jgi:5-methylcytosine-specific restriction endonuclease McrA